MVCVPLYWHKQSDSVWVNTRRSGTCLDAVVPLFTRVCRNPDGVEFPPPVKEEKGSKGVGTRSLIEHTLVNGMENTVSWGAQRWAHFCQSSNERKERETGTV